MMPADEEFTDSRDALARARRDRAAAQAALAQARERQRSLARQLDAAGGDAGQANTDLPAQVAAAGRGHDDARSALAGAEATLAAAAGRFSAYSDPRRGIGQLADDAPFLLFPVRIETRFMALRPAPPSGDPPSIVGRVDQPSPPVAVAGRVDQPGGRVASVGLPDAQPHLLVRIYPDDCSVDTFEEMFAATELSNVQRYWRNVWRAGGVEADERAAWRDLVAAHGSGRAGYLVDTYRPVNAASQPAKVNAYDVILVIVTHEAPPAEVAALAGYWNAAWTAGDDAAAVQAAYSALATALGGTRAAELIAAYVPANLADRPTAPRTRQTVAVSTVFLQLPPDPVTKPATWTQAPAVRHFPERFVVIGYAGGQPALQAVGAPVTLPLYVGPDPSADPVADPTSAIHPDGGDLFVPEQLRWLVDFDAALAAGMALSIPLTPAQAHAGFDRLLVVGLQLGTGAADGAELLEDLLRQHHIGRSGLSLVPQGTPTHNTTGAGTGYTKLDDADASFDDRRARPLFTPAADPSEKRDGQCVAEALGIDAAVLASVHGSGGKDQMVARAMQRAVWPATLGYWMDTMMTPVFDDRTIEHTRWFFTGYVRGAGTVPALRMGGQPYGILPTTAFSRMRWLDQVSSEPTRVDPHYGFLSTLHNPLTKLGQAWSALSRDAAHVGAGSDAHQTLLDVVGHHPSSVEFHARYAESLSELFNVQNLWGAGSAFLEALTALGLHFAAATLLADYGYTGGEQPDILQHYFLTQASRVDTVVDDRPLSETARIRPYTVDDRDYITWLADAAKASLDAVVAEQGFAGGHTPRALLYLYLRHAMMLGFYRAGYRLHSTVSAPTSPALLAMRREPTFVHVSAQAAAPSESRLALLYQPAPAVTADPQMSLSRYIGDNLRLRAEMTDLADQIDALPTLALASTGQLERAFAEHIDVCSYRYDAWLLGLVGYQLERMRAHKPRGTYLGAYAWVEDLRPAPGRLAPFALPDDLAKEYAGSTPIMSDPRNGGYIHAPSLPHARTAAVLRSGYLANATPDNPDTMAVNLSSDRVRLALSTLEGIRNGQSLGALLGYRFERGLHDDHGLAEVDQFIFPMRKAFPLVAGALKGTATGADQRIEAVEARNVLDGRKLVEHVRKTGKATYPFGLSTLPAASAAARDAISAQVDVLRDIYDAIADLALAEGVHQAVQGNFERIGATLEAYTSGHFPPDPDVVQTPPSGIGLTHRIGLHLRPGLTAPGGATPAGQAEPALDAWIGGLLPALSSIGATVAWNDPVTSAPHQLVVTLADLALHPIDLLDLVLPDNVAAMSQLDDRIRARVHAVAAPRPDADLHIGYLAGPPSGTSVFEVSALVRALRQLLAAARPLRATDVVPHGSARPEQDATVFVARSRVQAPLTVLDGLRADVAASVATLAPLVADPVGQLSTMLSNVDNYLDAAVALLDRAARFRLPSSGWGFALDWRHNAFTGLLDEIRTLTSRWSDRLTDVDARLAAYDALPAPTADDIRFGLLRTAEDLVATAPGPLPATPALLRVRVGGERSTFATRRDQVAALLATPSTTYSAVLAAFSGLGPFTDMDAAGYDLAPLQQRVVTFVHDLHATLSGLLSAIDARRKATTGLLAVHDTASSATTQVQALQDAAKALLGPDFRLIPEFTPAPAQAAEWASAVAAGAPGATLLDYLVTTAGVEEPVDEWLTSVARVRPAMRAWESTVTLVDAMRGPAAVPVLRPAQLPFEPSASWVAMQLKPGYTVDSERLCYTAHYSTPFDPTAAQCGLVLDEWTEVIPAPDHDTGITFHADRPDNEPPQALLLVTPASATGRWEWEDLVGALNETLDLAKVRAVEPAQVDGTAYAALVPATIMAATTYGITISTVLSVANDVMRVLNEQ